MLKTLRRRDHASAIWVGPDALADSLVPIDALRAHPRNPRIGDVDAIAASLKRFGQQRTILALPDGTIVAGHHVWKAARENQWTHVAVTLSNLTDREVDAYLVADNQLGRLGTFDDKVLAELLAEIDAGTQLALEGIGYTRSAVDELIADVAARGRVQQTDPDEVPPVPEEPRSEPGTVYELGPHRLMCGDSTDPEHVEKLLAGTIVDLLVTDPPYGVDYASRGRMMRFERGDGQAPMRIENDSLGADGTKALVRDALEAALPALKKGGSFYVCCPPGGDLEVAFRVAVMDTGLLLKQGLVWVKDSLVLGRSDYHYRHEAILYGWKPGAAHYFTEDRSLTTVWEIPRPKRSDEHPTMKPVELYERAIRNSSRPGQVVFDPFGGSGTLAIAAESTGRRGFLMELDPRYCDVIRRRYADHTGQPELAP